MLEGVDWVSNVFPRNHYVMLAVAFANAPDGRIRLSAFHDRGIILSEPRTQFATAASRALHVVGRAQIGAQYLRLRTGPEAVTFHRLQSFAIQAR